MPALPAEEQNIYLLVKTGGNGTTLSSFATGYTIYTGTLSGSEWFFDVNFASGDNFTFATESPRVSLSVDTGAIDENG